MDHKARVTCPHCEGKGTLKMPADVATAVCELSNVTMQSTLLRLLASRFEQWIRSEAILAHLYAGTDRMGDRSVLRTTVCYLRKKLLPYGLTIEGQTGAATPGGYRLIRADCIELPHSGFWLPKRRA